MSHLFRHEPFRHPAAERAQRSAFRYTLLLAVAFLVGAPGAFMALTNPEVSYTAEGNLWIEGASRRGSHYGATARTEGLPESGAWIALLRSYQVLEPVVVDQRLYVRSPEEYAPAFASLTVAERFRPGTYELRVGDAGEDFVLVTGEGALVQRGRFGLPIGQNVGFIWTPSGSFFAPRATVEFSVLSVRDAAQDLSKGLIAVMDREGSFLRVALEGPDPQELVDVLNAVMERHVELASELKRTKHEETLALLEGQLQTMELELEQAERDLEESRVGTISDSSDRSLRPAEGAIEGRPRRRVQTTENLYTEVRGRVETARLAAASWVPDVRIIDHASVQERKEDVRLPIAAAMLLGCLVAAVGGTLLFDRRVVTDAAELRH